MGDLTIMHDGRVALRGPHSSDPALTGTHGRWVYHLGIDLGQANDPTAFSIIEDKQLPLPEYDEGGRQILGERQLSVVHLERMEHRAYTQVARHAAALVERAPLRGRTSVVIDGTGVGRSFVDMFREMGLAFTPVTITSSSGEAKGDFGYWNVGKAVLLSELAARLETGALRITNTPMGRALMQELGTFEVSYTSSGNMTVDVRSSDHHGDLVIATALALWSATRTRGFVGEGRLENWY